MTQRRFLPLTCMLAISTCLLPARAAHAQDVLDAKSAAHIHSEYLADLDMVHAKIVALAEAIPADKYSWRPSPDVRSVSEVLMHVAGEWYYVGPGCIGETLRSRRRGGIYYARSHPDG